MKILHIAPDYPNSKLYPQLISTLERTGCGNSVYVQSDGSDDTHSYPVYFLGRNFGIIDRILFFRKQNVIFNDIEHRNLVKDINIIHAHQLFSAGYNAYRIKKKYHIPYVVAVRNTDVNDFFHQMVHLRPLGVRIMREAEAVIFLSPSYRDSVINKYVPNRYRQEVLEKCHVIPNGLDSFFMENKAAEPRKLRAEKTVRLIYVGDIDKNKNVGTTIKACQILRDRGYKVSLDVVGKIMDKKLEYIKSVDFVNYHPFSPKEEVLEYIKKSDIFVMPSIHETFGLVYIEAMSQGLPVIYSKGQGFDGYFAEGEVGYHVPCFDETAIADSAIKIMSDYVHISNNCINVVESFSWEKKADDYLKIYQSI